MDRGTFHSLARHLKRRITLSRPVSVVTCKLSRGLSGDCTRKTGWYLIRVACDLGTEEAVGTLLHEYSHALSWGLDGHNDHGEYFTLANATVWGEYLVWLKEQGG